MHEQEQQWLAKIKEKGSITNRDAVVDCWIMSPTKVISNLRKIGYKISHTRETTSKGKWFYRYFLEGEVA